MTGGKTGRRLAGDAYALQSEGSAALPHKTLEAGPFGPSGQLSTKYSPSLLHTNMFRFDPFCCKLQKLAEMFTKFAIPESYRTRFSSIKLRCHFQSKLPEGQPETLYQVSSHEHPQPTCSFR